MFRRYFAVRGKPRGNGFRFIGQDGNRDAGPRRLMNYRRRRRGPLLTRSRFNNNNNIYDVSRTQYSTNTACSRRGETARESVAKHAVFVLFSRQSARARVRDGRREIRSAAFAPASHREELLRVRRTATIN